MYIELENVTVAYGNTPILRNISLAFPEGKSIGVVGRSGAGKSTLALLLLRDISPINGYVLVNGERYERYQKNSVKRLIGTIPQESLLMSGTARENILHATHPEDMINITDDAIWYVLDSLTPMFRERFNGHGLDTMVGKQGLQLSGGQKQLVCIARALIKNPEFLIVDEATASLDAETEIMVQTGIDTALASGRSAMVIAHRLSTQRNCDEIVVMKKVMDCTEGESQIEGVYDSQQQAYRHSQIYRKLADQQGFQP